jgi:hypothetical protein
MTMIGPIMVGRFFRFGGDQPRRATLQKPLLKCYQLLPAGHMAGGPRGRLWL